ncbi:MAG TPA: imidazole glycerol phosphate synthase subunit HisH [Xanthomonadales bacterium]|nr:imidazole glycerol phosphate synthase subunit HisH [Xanthomonadales bacterium]
MTIAVVDSGGANIASVFHALRRLGVEPTFTRNASDIRQASHVILPGVGAASGAMEKLREFRLAEVIRNLTQPVLGVCLGMQLLFESTEEGDTGMLGLIPERIRKLAANEGLRVPHMGWNKITTLNKDSMCIGSENEWFYFVHSYAAPVGDFTLATAEHGPPFSAIVRQGNFYGAQFHPERSAKAGEALLNRFLEV